MCSVFPKKAALFAAVACTLSFVFSFTVDLWAQKRLPFVEAALSEALQRPIEIRRAGYTLTHGFALEDLTVKEIKTVPVPFTVERVRAHASFELYPRPKIRIHRVVFERPRLGLVGNAEELFRAGSLVRKLPVYRSVIGRVALEMRLSAFEVKEGRVIVFTDTRGTRVRQEFEHIDFFAGERGFRKNRMRVSGRIAGKPEARFHIDSDLLREGPGTFDSNVRIDLHEFTSSYLAPYLQDRFKLPEKDLSASLRLKIRDGRRIESDGRFDLPSIGFDDRLLRYLTRRSPKFRYYVMGYWRKDSIEFSRIHLKGRTVRLAGTGRISLTEGRESYKLSLSSDPLPLEKFRNLPGDWRFTGGSAGVVVRAAGSPKRFEPVIEIALNNASALDDRRGFRLDNAKGLLRLTPSSVELDDLWVFMNDFPLRASGRIANGPGRRSVSLDLATFPGQIPLLRGHNPVNGTLRLRAEEKEGAWNGYARARLDEPGFSPHSRRDATVAFKGLSLEKRAAGWLLLRSLETDGKRLLKPLAVRAARFALRYDRERARLDLLSARVEGGLARGTFRIDLKDGDWKSRFDLEAVRLEALGRLFFLDLPLEGTLSLRGHVLGGPRSGPSARLAFEAIEGKIGPSAWQKDWAGQTGVETLREIRFDRISGWASLKSGLWRLREVRLTGPQTALSADFQLREGRVNGRLSVRFPAGSIRPGSALSWLLAFVGGQDWVDFDFHLAGEAASPRIEWLAGEFKKKIERTIPEFLRVPLARQIEQRLAVS